MRRSGTAQDELRRRNLSALLAEVHVSGPTTRAALTSTLGLNRSTIGDLTSALEAAGLIREEVPAQGVRTGRPSHVVVPRSEQVTVLGVSIDVDAITVARVGLGGVVLDRRERRHHRGGHEARAVAVSVAQLCKELLPESGRCLGVGVSVPGVVRAEDGLVRFAPNLGWVDEPFAAMLADSLDLAVHMGNDANLGVLAEHLRGAATGIDDVAYLTGGVGLGGGFLIGGTPLRGHGGYGGEVGHLVVNPGGHLCHCGSRGCWETEVGENCLLEAAGRLPGGGPAAVAEVIAAADAGEVRAERALARVAHWTGIGLGAIVTVFNPSAVLLGGVLKQMWAARRSLVTDSMAQAALGAPREQATVTAAGLGDDSSLLGAAELAFAPMLADPLGRWDSPVAAG